MKLEVVQFRSKCCVEYSYWKENVTQHSVKRAYSLHLAKNFIKQPAAIKIKCV